MGITFLILLLLWLFLQTNYGQKKALPIALNYLSKTIGSPVKASKVDISFFDEIQLEDILVLDSKGDSLIFIEHFEADISIFSLFGKQIHIDQMSLKGVDLSIEELEDTTFNYDHILTHLNSKTTTKEDKNTQPWDISLSKLELTDFDFNYLTKGSTIQTTIPFLKGKVSNLALENSLIEFDKLSINGLAFDLEKKTSEVNNKTALAFPSLPIDLLVKELSVNGKKIQYKDTRNTDLSSTEILILTDINVKAEHLSWNDSIALHLQAFGFTLNDGFTLQNLSTDLLLSKEALGLNNTIVETGSSRIEFTAKSTYASFDSLINDIQNTNSNVLIDYAYLSKKDLEYFIQNEPISFMSINALKDLTANGEIILENNTLKAKELSISVDGKFALDGNLSLDLSNTGRHVFNISNISTSQRYLNQILPTLKFPDQLNDLGFISGKCNGTIHQNTVFLNSFLFRSSKGSIVQGAGRIKNYNSENDLAYDIKFSKLSTNINDLISKDPSIPEELFKLEDISYTGIFKGTLKNVEADGYLTTSLGNLELNARSKFNEDYSSGDYTGYFDLQNFDLGYMLNDTTLGISNFKGTITGSGFSLSDLEADIDGTVSSFCYDGYIYKNITIDGSYQDSIFDGKIKSRDDNVNLDLEGRIDLKGETTSMDITMNMSSLDLGETGLSNEAIVLGGIFKGRVKGNSIDDFEGSGHIFDLSIQSDKGTYLADSLVEINVRKINENAKSFKIESPFFTGEIQGKIKPSGLLRYVKNYIKAYIPLEIGYDEELEDNLETYFKLNEDQNFIISAETGEINSFLKPFFGENLSLKYAKLGAYFSSEETRLDIKGSIDSLMYKGILFQRGSYFFDGRKSFINGNINLEDISMDNEVLVPVTTINTSLNNKVADFNLVMSNENDFERLNIRGDLTRTDEYIMTFKDSVYLSGFNWEFSPYNQIIFGDYGLYMQDVKISKGDQAITIYTDENENGEAIEILFDDFIISELSSIIEKENEYLEGHIDGSLVINSLYSKPFITADLDLEEITISDHKAGKLSIEAQQDISSNTVKSKIRLLGPQNDASMDLVYGIDNGSTNGELDVQKLEMAIIDPYLTELFIDSEGYVSGKIKIDGSLNNLDLSGKLSTHDVKTTPVFTNSRYAVEDTEVSFSDTEIDFGSVVLRDRHENTATVSGKIYHKNLRNSIIDLNVYTEKFEFLNTSSIENELFYGRVNIQGNATVKGPIDDIEIDGSVTAVDGSKLNVSPLSLESDLFADDFIIYSGDPRKIPFDSLTLDIRDPKLKFPFDIDVKVNIDDDSEFIMIVNPITGDKITCRGNSNLNLKLNKAGEMTLFGTYSVTEGEYAFSYGLISKKFNIQPGSTVSFNGNPLDGILDVDAVYVANTSVYELLKLESDLSDAQKSEAQRKRDINVVLSLSDKIIQPTILLDITTDEDDLSAISDVLARKLQQLRTEPDELNNQVFGLLLFNSFILARNAETDLAKTGTDIAIRSVSGLIASQLNKLAEGILEGFEVNFDINSYSSDFLAQGQEGVITELGLGVKQTLIDDRLTISAGTNINLESTSQASAFNTIAGDFILSYKLNKDGNYIIKAFRKSSYDRLIDENASKNGASFFIRKEFGTIEKKKK